MKCGFCSAELPDGFRFCGHCGSALAGTARPSKELCPVCNSAGEPGSRFCGQCSAPLRGGIRCSACGELCGPEALHCSGCGSRLGKGVTGGALGRRSIAPARGTLHGVAHAPAAEIRDEKKVVTVLFSDISGFTAMSENMDPEELKELMDAALSRLSEEIVAFGGTIDKYIGDAIMAIFGTPVSREDDAERAVRSAVAMQTALGNFAAERGAPLRMRVGLNTGPAMLGAVGQKRGDLTAMGDTVNLAQRMESNAPVGGVLITAATAATLRNRFELEEQPPLKVKGKAEPIHAFVVKGERAAETAWSTPLVGRELELGALAGAFLRVAGEGSPHLVTLSGDAGLGKTRLVAEWARGVDAEFLAGAAAPFEFAPPYLPFTRMIRSFIGSPDSDGPARSRERLLAKLSPLFPDGAEARVELLLYLMQSLPEGSPLLAQMEQDPKGVRRRAFAVAEDVLVRAAEERPLLLVVDDAHLARSPMLELVRALVAAPRGRFLVLLLGRAELFTDGGFGTEGPRQDHVTLAPLGDSAAAALADALLSRVESAPEVLRRFLLDRAAGNPYYMEELVRALRDRNVLAAEEDRERFDPDRFRPDEMPHGVVALLQARLENVGEKARSALRAGSVLGPAFWDSAVAAILPGADVAPLLDEAVERELVALHVPSEIGAARQFDFRPALLQEVAYSSLLKKERIAAHAAAAGWLEKATSGRKDEYFERIAHQWLEGDRPEKAFPYLVEAGDRAARLFVTDQALALLDRAIAIAEGGKVEVPRAERRRLRLLRARTMRFAGSYADAEADLGSAEEGSRAAGDRAAEAEVRLEKATLYEAWQRLSDAEALANQAVAGARQSDARESLARALSLIGSVTFRQGSLDPAAAALEESHAIWTELGDQRRAASTLLNLANVWLYRGSVPEAADAMLRASETFRRTGDKPWLSTALNNLGVCRCILGDDDLAAETFDEALRLSRSIGDRGGMEMALSNLGRIRERLGDFAGAAGWFRESIALARAMGRTAALAEGLLELARVLVGSGDPSAAGLVSEAEALGEAERMEPIRCEATLLRGEIAAADGDAVASRELAAAALDVADRLERSDYRAWARWLLGRADVEGGEPERGLPVVRQALREAEESGERALAARIRTTLDQAGGAPVQSTP